MLFLSVEDASAVDLTLFVSRIAAVATLYLTIPAQQAAEISALDASERATFVDGQHLCGASP